MSSFVLPGKEYFRDLVVHFDRALAAAESVGTDIRMDCQGHPEFKDWVQRVKSGGR